MGLRDVVLIRGDERRAAVRRRTGLPFLLMAGCCCSARGDVGASKLVLASLGGVELGLKALEIARGEMGDLGEPRGDLALRTGNRDFEGEYDNDRLILFIDENGDGRCRVPPASRGCENVQSIAKDCCRTNLSQRGMAWADGVERKECDGGRRGFAGTRTMHALSCLRQNTPAHVLRLGGLAGVTGLRGT
jgi:hypothetical protein